MPKKHSLVSLERRSNSPQTPLKNHPPFHILLTLKTQFRDPDHNSTHHHVIATPPKLQKGSVTKASTPDHRPNTRSTSKRTTDRLTKSVTKSPIGRQTRASIANSNSKHRTSPTQTRKSGTATGSQRFYNTVVTRNTRSRVGHTTPKRGAQTKKPTSTHKDKRSAEKGNNVGRIASPRTRRNANNIPQYTGYNTRSSTIYVKREEMEVEPTVQTRSRYNIETKLKKEHMSPRILNKPKSPRHRKATPVVVSSDSEVEKGSYWTSPVSRHRSRTNAAKTSPKRAQRVTPSHKGRGMTERVTKATKRRRPIETINLEEDEDENDFAKETRTPAKKGMKSRAEIKSQRKVENKIQRAKESLPKFPKKEEDIESLIVEAVNALKNQDLEKRIMDYFDKKFAGVNKRSVKNVIEHIEFDAKLVAQNEVQSRGGVKVEENRSTITTKQEEPFNRTLFPEHSNRKSLSRMSTRLRDERLKIEEPQIQSTKVEENEEQVKRVRFKDVQVVEDESEDDVVITKTRSRNKAEQKRRPSLTENKVINTPEIPAKRKRGRPPKKDKESITKTEVKISASKSPGKMNIIPAKASISRSAGKASISREPEEAEEKPKRKRGRPRKQQGPYYELTEKAMSSVSIPVEEEKKPKRRGRPPKQKKEEQVEVQENMVTGKKSLEKQQIEDLEEEAIEEEMEVEVETEVEVEPTKRGRKSKSPMEKTSTMSTETSGKYLEEKELSQLKSARTQAKGSQSKASVSKKSLEGTSERPIEVPDLPSERKQMSNRTVRKTPAKPSDFVLEPKKQSTRSARRSSRSKREDPIEIIDDDHEEKIQRVFENPLKSIIADLSLEIDRESDQKKSEEVDSPELTIHDFQLPKEDFKTTMGKMILPGLREEAVIMERKRGNLLTESEKLKDKLRENIAKFFEEEKVRLTKEGKIRLYGSDKFGAWEKALKRNVDALEGGENRETIMSTKEIEIDKESDRSDSIVEIEEISFEETKRNRGEPDLEIEYNKELGIEEKQEKKLVKRMAVEIENEKVRESEFLKTPSSYKTQSKGSGSARDPLFKTPENLSFQNEGFSRPKPLDLPSANMDIDKLSLISPGRTLGGNESVPFLSAIQSALRDPNGSEARHRIDYEGVFVQKFNVFGNNGDDKDKINDLERRDLETSDIQEPKPIKKRKLNEEKSPQGSEPKEGESEGHHEKMVVEEEPLSESVPEAKNTDQNESHELE